MPVSALHDEFERDELLFSRALQGIVVRLGEDHEVVGTQLHHPDFFETGMSFAGGIVFQPTTVSQEVAAGRLTFDGARQNFRFDVTFSAPVVRRPALTEADLASEPVKVLRAFLQAISDGDREAILALVRADDVGDFSGTEGDELIAMMAGAGLDAMEIAWVSVTGDTAKLFLEEADGSGRFRIHLAVEDGAWKVGSPLR